MALRPRKKSWRTTKFGRCKKCGGQLRRRAVRCKKCSQAAG